MLSRRMRRRVGLLLTYGVIGFILIAILLPVFWMVMTGFKMETAVLAVPPQWVPVPGTLKNYYLVLRYGGAAAIANSLIITISTTLISIVVGTSAAYASARFGVGGRSLALWILSLRMLPPVASVIPFFFLMKMANLIDTHLAMIMAHTTFVLPLAFWMMRGFIAELPKDLEEAAELDGCSSVGVITKIVAPLAAPGLFATALFSFMFSWNDYIFSLVLTRINARTLPYQISMLSGSLGVEWAQTSALSTLGIIPLIILMILVQKYLIKGMAMGAVRAGEK